MPEPRRLPSTLASHHPMPSSAPSPPSGRTCSPGVQQFVSLVLILHLFCVLVALTSYTQRSPLQDRLLSVLAPYTRTLDIAPTVAPYHYTQYDALTGDGDLDDEIYIEIDIENAAGEREKHHLDQLGFGFPDAHKRYSSYAREMAFYVTETGGGDTELGEFAKSVTRYALTELGADAGVLRLKRHISQPRALVNLREGFPQDPLAVEYERVLYEADILLADDGEPQVIKREGRGEVAPVRSAGEEK
jgi:hypothetical protein